jgi:glutamate racemase
VAHPPTILVFDSGVGGLSVYREVVKLMPGARYVYLADDAAFPYGRFAPDVLAKRVVKVLGAAIARFKPDLVVVACNTASTVAMPALRAAYSVPFVGTVPAVKPAAALSKTKVIAVLGTPGTVSREYTHDLIIQHAAQCRVTLVGARNLAMLAEQHWRGEAVADADVLAEITPCFVTKDGARTDVVVLACTHYPLLLDVYRRVAPWEVTYVDPASAIARRAADLLNLTSVDQISVEKSGDQKSLHDVFFTSGAFRSGTFEDAFGRFGLSLKVSEAHPFSIPYEPT